jgi:hypothetical protein
MTETERRLAEVENRLLQAITDAKNDWLDMTPEEHALYQSDIEDGTIFFSFDEHKELENLLHEYAELKLGGKDSERAVDFYLALNRYITEDPETAE